MQWVVFELNDQRLGGRLRNTAYDFLTRIWRDRTPVGRKSEEALFVKSDEMKMTPNDIESR
jgi:hypothetical protein